MTNEYALIQTDSSLISYRHSIFSGIYIYKIFSNKLGIYRENSEEYEGLTFKSIKIIDNTTIATIKSKSVQTFSYSEVSPYVNK